MLASQARGVRGRARARRPRRRRHLLDPSPHPRPARAGPGPAAWALAHQLGHVLMHGALPRQPGATTSGDACTGTRKAEADAVAFIIFTRYGIAAAAPARQPRHLGRHRPARPARRRHPRRRRADHRRRRASHPPPRRPSSGAGPAVASRAGRGPAPAPPQPPRQRAAGADARRPPARASRPCREQGCQHPARRRRRSTPAGWRAAGRLPTCSSRGIGQDTARAWQIGYAPAEWTALTDHLRAAGLRRRGDRGGRAGPPVLPRNAHRPLPRPGHAARPRPGRRGSPGSPAAPGRARARGPEVPQQPRDQPLQERRPAVRACTRPASALADGAIPVIVEGPFDAIAVTIAGAGRYAGLAPCGTALTTGQVTLLAASLRPGQHRGPRRVRRRPGRPQGRHPRLRPSSAPHTSALASAALAGRDPAQILQRKGPQALRERSAQRPYRCSASSSMPTSPAGSTG